MLIELYILAFIIIAYGTFTTIALVGFGKLTRTLKLPVGSNEHPFISIVLSARNEEQYITQCLQSIFLQNFPIQNFELILIDDDSTDNTYLIANTLLQKSNINYQFIQQPTQQGKKKNLTQAINLAKGTIIVTTDADVTYRHMNWLLTISQYFKTNTPSLLIMPIDFETHNSILTIFQIVENIALTGITAGYVGIGKPFMCSGANLAFTKKVFQEINGYQTHLHISSGDDVFLLEAVKTHHPSSSVHYYLSRELIVKTNSQKDFKSLFNQRVRWANKAKYNTNIINAIAGILVLLANLIYPILLYAIIAQSPVVGYLVIFAFTKFVFDFLLLFLASDLLGRIKYIWWLIPFECVYWVYALITGILSLVYKPSWKETKIN